MKREDAKPGQQIDASTVVDLKFIYTGPRLKGHGVDGLEQFTTVKIVTPPVSQPIPGCVIVWRVPDGTLWNVKPTDLMLPGAVALSLQAAAPEPAPESTPAAAPTQALLAFRYASGEEPCVGDVVKHVAEVYLHRPFLRRIALWRVRGAAQPGVLHPGVYLEIVLCNSHGRPVAKYVCPSAFSLVERAGMPEAATDATPTPTPMPDTFRYASGEEPLLGDVVKNAADASLSDPLLWRVTKALSEGAIEGGHIDLVLCGSCGRQVVKYARANQYTLVDGSANRVADQSFEERKRESYSVGVPSLGPPAESEMDKTFEAWRGFVERAPSAPAYAGRYDAPHGIANMSLAELDELACYTNEPRSWTINATLKQQKDAARWRMDDYDLNREPIRGPCRVVGCGLRACMHPRPHMKSRSR